MKTDKLFLDKRDIVQELKDQQKRVPRKQHTKSKYALIVEDDFGHKKIEYYICTEKKIQQLLFKKYILLKSKAVKDDTLGKELQPKTQVIKANALYKVRLDVGFKLFHHIYYTKLDDSDTYLVVQYDIHTSHYLGYYDRAKASKVAFDKALKDSRYAKDADDSERVHKIFYRQSFQIRFDYWYKCSYEYDEWDESSVIVVAKQIKFKKRR